MAISNDIHWVDPKSIYVGRETRQRKKVDIGDLVPSIRARGILHPLIVQRGAFHPYLLVSGERRLTTALFLEMQQVPIRTLENLSPIELQLIELDENLKREDLSWQDQATSFVRIHQAYLSLNGEEWTTQQTADMTGYHFKHIDKMIDLGEAILEGDKSVAEAETIANATTILARRRQRQTGEALNRILEIQHAAPLAGKPAPSQPSGDQVNRSTDSGASVPGSPGAPQRVPAEPAPVKAPEPSFAILQGDMHDFLGSFSGPRFNFLHCDLPYGVELNEQAGQAAFEGGGYESSPDIYWAMCNSLIRNWEKFMYPSAHVVFWISMKFYTETVQHFQDASEAGIIPRDLRINPTPIIWHKTDNRGILPDPMRMPRNIYEAALIMSTGDRYLVKPVANVYGCPTSKSTSIHTNEKPEPMLKHFLSMFIDGHSRVFDPTCGSGSAIRAAEALGAEAGLGLEHNAEFAERANDALVRARGLRNLSGLIADASVLDSPTQE